MPMTCEQAEQLMARVIHRDASLPENVRLRFRAHTVTCEQCQQRFEDIKIVIGLLLRNEPSSAGEGSLGSTGEPDEQDEIVAPSDAGGDAARLRFASQELTSCAPPSGAASESQQFDSLTVTGAKIGRGQFLIGQSSGERERIQMSLPALSLDLPGFVWVSGR